MTYTYEFGSITIDGKTYRTDVILYPDRVDDHWWRQETHRLCLEDLDDVLHAQPDILIVGTGYFGRMQIDPAVARAMNKQGISLVSCLTKEVCAEFNRLTPSREVIAVLHLTC